MVRYGYGVAVRRCGRIGRAETRRCKAEPQRWAPRDQRGGVSASASAGMLVYSGCVWQARTPLVRAAASVSMALPGRPRSKVPRTNCCSGPQAHKDTVQCDVLRAR